CRAQLGHAYFKEKSYPEAITQFKKALESNPDTLEPREGLGLCYFEQGNTEEALTEFNRILKSGLDNENVRFGLGICYNKKKEFKKAVEEFIQVLKINPNHLQAKDMLSLCRAQLGHAYFKEKSYPEAITQFKKALESNPDTLELREGLARAYLEKGELEFCLAEAQNAKQLGLVDRSYLRILARVYINQKKYELAIEELQKLSNLEPNSEFVADQFLRIYSMQKNYQLAKERAGVLININPFNYSAYNILGNIYFEEKDYSKALSQFQKVLELYLREDSIQKKTCISKDDFMKIYFNIGSAYLLMREYKLAIENLNNASLIEPGNNKIKEMISIALIGIGDYNLGVDTLINCGNASDEVSLVNKNGLAKQDCKIKILRIPNFYGAEVLSTEMNSIVMPPLPLGNIVAYARSQGIRLEQDDLHIKIHHDNYFSKDQEKKIDEEVFFDIPRVIRYAKGESDTELDKTMDKVSDKTNLHGYKIILFSLDSCSMNDSHVMFALCLARYLKKKYNPIIILGGLNYFVDLMRKNGCDFPDMDYVIYFEGEEVIVNLILSILKLSDFRTQDLKVEENGRLIKSIKVPKPIKPYFDGLPLDMYKYIGLKTDYFSDKALRELVEEFNRSQVFLLPFRFIKGCTNRCIFCASSVGGLIHAVRPETVALWLEELQEEYNPTGYLFLSDTLNISNKYLDGLCNEIIKRKLKIRWSDCVRTDRLDKDSIYKLRDAGCIRMVFGMETASRKLLDYIKKDIDLDQLEEMLRWADKAGIWTGIEIISGLPYEDEKDVDETISFLRRNREYIDALYYNAFNIKDTSLIQAYPEKYKISNIFELSSYEDGFSTFVKYGFDETYGLKWPEKRKQIISALNKIIENFGSPPFPEHEYESFLFFLYSRYKDKKTIRNLFYSVGKEKIKYLTLLQREKKKNCKIKVNADKILTYG
ncbi:MAG: tetratricopeptide repeat protein, partial [Candidatus Omnitrophica bacterium]|nr:tetratricopeptide repeat protein [Candidatus Omnitrophota bacterium]